MINYYKFSSLEHTQVLFTAVSVDPESRHGLGGPPSAFGLTHLQARPRRATGVTSAPRLCQVVGRMSFRGAFWSEGFGFLLTVPTEGCPPFPAAWPSLQTAHSVAACFSEANGRTESQKTVMMRCVTGVTSITSAVFVLLKQVTGPAHMQRQHTRV